ncbi:MAG: aspartate/glutamate racemase family protein [Pararhodobacter sp.]|nr:aspartate/glutamate racemase family protein [Pararhodobacter sp.]
MHTIGLVGGMSWHSSALYYRRLNALAERRWGPGVTPRSVLVTLPFADLQEAGGRGNWDLVTDQIVSAARDCVASGADLILLTAFTAHVAAPAVAAAISVPLLHAGDALAAAVPHGPVGLLGTAATLEADHVRERLLARGHVVLTPGAVFRTALDQAIQRDLAQGRITPGAQAALAAAAADLVSQGAASLALACTELPLLALDQLPLPAIDGVEAHVAAALNALETA